MTYAKYVVGMSPLDQKANPQVNCQEKLALRLRSLPKNNQEFMHCLVASGSVERGIAARWRRDIRLFKIDTGLIMIRRAKSRKL